jgi:hypothetical protein
MPELHCRRRLCQPGSTQHHKPTRQPQPQFWRSSLFSLYDKAVLFGYACETV